MGMLINLFLEPDGNKLNVLVFTRERRCCRSCESGSKIVANFILPLSLVKTLDNDSETKVQLESEHVDPQNVEFQTRIENGLGKPHSSVEISQEENVHSLEKSINSVISSDCMNDQVAFGIESTSIGSTDIRALEVQNTNTDLFVENSIFASNLQSQDSNEKRKDDIQKPTEKREANSNTNDNEIVHFVTETSNPLITKSYTKTFSSSDWNVNDSEVLKCDLPVMIDTSDKTSHENLQTNFIASESRLTDAVTHSNVRSINYEQYILPAEDELAIDNQIYVPLSNVSIKTENVCEESIPANTEIQPVKTEPYDNLENSEQDYSGIIPTSITNVVIEVVKAEVSSVEGHNEKLIKYDVDSVKAEAVPSPEFLACEFGPSLNEFCPSTVKIKKKISFADPLCTDLEQVVEAIKKPVGDVDDVQQHQKPTIEKPNVTSTNEIQTAKHGETIEQMKILEKNLNISSSEYTGVLKQIKKRSHEIEKKFSALTITNSELKNLLSALDVHVNKANDIIRSAIVQQEGIDDLVEKTMSGEKYEEESLRSGCEETSLIGMSPNVNAMNKAEDSGSSRKVGKRGRKRKKKMQIAVSTTVKRTRSQTGSLPVSPRILLERFEDRKSDKEIDIDRDDHVFDNRPTAESTSALSQDVCLEQFPIFEIPPGIVHENSQPESTCKISTVSCAFSKIETKSCSPKTLSSPKKQHKRQPPLSKYEAIKMRTARKKLRYPLVNLDSTCFACHKGGILFYCENTVCSRGYHIKCIKMKKLPYGRWLCPWHFCSICMSRSRVKKCAECLNAFCGIHVKGNIYIDGQKYVCQKHKSDTAINSDGDSVIGDRESDIGSYCSSDDMKEVCKSNLRVRRTPAAMNNCEVINLIDEDKNDNYKTEDLYPEAAFNLFSHNGNSRKKKCRSNSKKSALHLERNNDSNIDIIDLVNENEEDTESASVKQNDIVDLDDEVILGRDSRRTISYATCDKSFVSKNELALHVSDHGDIMSDDESDQRNIANGNEHLKQLISSEEQPKVYSCEMCESSEAMGNCKNSRQRKTNYVCNYCDKPFQSLVRVRMHIRTVHQIQMITSSSYHTEPVDQFDCFMCSFQCRSKICLKMHLKTHTNCINEFVCFLCDQKFNSEASFKLHVRTAHENELEKNSMQRDSANSISFKKHAESSLSTSGEQDRLRTKRDC